MIRNLKKRIEVIISTYLSLIAGLMDMLTDLKNFIIFVSASLSWFLMVWIFVEVDVVYKIAIALVPLFILAHGIVIAVLLSLFVPVVDVISEVDHM